MPVAMHVAPQRRNAVDVAAAFGVDERRPLGALDDDRLLLDPALLLGERVPDVAVIVGGKGHAAQATARASRKRGGPLPPPQASAASCTAARSRGSLRSARWSPCWSAPSPTARRAMA